MFAKRREEEVARLFVDDRERTPPAKKKDVDKEHSLRETHTRACTRARSTSQRRRPASLGKCLVLM
jgi:hypothetical protein